MKHLLLLLITLSYCASLSGQCSVRIVEERSIACGGDATGELFAEATGTAPFTYLWSTGSEDSIHTNLPAGTYTVTITAADNCTAEATATLVEPNLLVASVSIDDVACNGDATGELCVTVSGGVEPYTYDWSHGESTACVTGLAAGDYTVTITDANGCEDEATSTVSEPTVLNVVVNGDGVDCNDENTGELTAFVSGGTPPYTYLWSDGQFSSTIDGLPMGDYTVTVTDANGCADTSTGRITGPIPIFLRLTAWDGNCGEEGGTNINLTVIEGSPPFAFVWEGPGVNPNSEDQFDVEAGTYYVTVTDAGGCMSNDSISTEDLPEGPMISIGTVTPSCDNACDGSILGVTATGGVPAYTFQWSNGVTTADNFGLCTGDYSLTVTDANGCEASMTVFVPAKDTFALVVEAVDVTCLNDCEGEITLSPDLGTGDYTFNWSDAATSTGQTAVRTNLCPGDYSVTVTNGDLCPIERIITVSAATDLAATFTQTGGDCNPNGGEVIRELTVTGGTSPYSFNWSDGSTGDTIPTYDPFALYTVTVTDSEGCETIVADLRSVVVGLGSFFTTLVPQECAGGVVYAGGFPDGFSLIAVPPFGDTLFGDELLLTEVGRYEVYGLSPNGTCLLSGTVNVDEYVTLPDTMSIDVTVRINNSCNLRRCLELVGLPPAIRFDPALETNLYAPSGVALPITNLSSRRCINDVESGLYHAEIVYNCDTVNFFFDMLADPCTVIEGTVYAEVEETCSLDGSDVAADGIVVRLTNESTGEIFHTITNNEGEYEIELPVATYLIEPLRSGEVAPSGCDEVRINNAAPVATVADIFVTGTNCGPMETWISITRQVRCFQNGMGVYYRNPTADTIRDVVVTVELDPFYVGVSATVPIASQVGQLLTFSIGDVPPFRTQNFQVFYTISCDAELGQTHCTRSEVFPNGFCQEAPDWSGALVNIDELTCDGDSITFRVSNIGTNPMTIPLNYIVIEDGIMMTPVPIINGMLEVGEVFEVTIPAEGETYQVRTNQEPGAPVDNERPSLLINGCDGSAVIPTNDLGNFFTLGNGVPWEDIVCRRNRGSYDPNDKFGYPLGYDGGQIEPGTRLAYEIRFQNTGTDTAYTVIIRDTLPEALDLATLKLEGGTHEYDISLDTNRVLTFVFNEINLVDSTTNLAGSQGMISFSINHNPLLQPGEFIDNQAAIYFDFNEPVITNLSRHMIAIEPLPNSTRQQLAQSIAVEVYPNPADSEIRVRLPQSEVRPGDRLLITDLYGRRLGASSYASASDGWDVRHLPAGNYLLVVTDAAGRARGRTGFVVGK